MAIAMRQKGFRSPKTDIESRTYHDCIARENELHRRKRRAQPTIFKWICGVPGWCHVDVEEHQCAHGKIAARSAANRRPSLQSSMDAVCRRYT